MSIMRVKYNDRSYLVDLGTLFPISTRMNSSGTSIYAGNALLEDLSWWIQKGGILDSVQIEKHEGMNMPAGLSAITIYIPEEQGSMGLTPLGAKSGAKQGTAHGQNNGANPTINKLTKDQKASKNNHACPSNLESSTPSKPSHSNIPNASPHKHSASSRNTQNIQSSIPKSINIISTKPYHTDLRSSLLTNLSSLSLLLGSEWSVGNIREILYGPYSEVPILEGASYMLATADDYRTSNGYYSYSLVVVPADVVPNGHDDILKMLLSFNRY